MLERRWRRSAQRLLRKAFDDVIDVISVVAHDLVSRTERAADLDRTALDQLDVASRLLRSSSGGRCC
jgi:hypothetical protein